MRFFIILFLFGLFGCAPKVHQGDTGRKPQPEEITWKGLQRLLGEWYESSQNTYEEWESNGNYSLNGEGYTKDVAGNHITEARFMLMWAPNISITYAATIMRNNMGRQTRFVLTHADANSYTFENEQHDFPKKIKYTIKSADAFETTLSAGQKSITYYYSRVKPEE